MTLTYDDYLEHFGVKGMKWGVRRKEGPDGLVGNKASKEPIDNSKKSKRRVHLEAKYISKGSDQATAENKANRRVKTEKVLLAVGAVAVGTAVAVGAKNYHTKMLKGVNLDMGVEMKNLNALGDKQDLDRRLYVSLDERDSKKYRGLLAQSLRMNRDASAIYESTLTAKANIKAPSQRQAKKLYKEFTNNSRYAKPYSEFNKNLVSYTEQNEKFYDFMSKKGYNALLDYNDQFISGYNSKRPLILFNADSTTSKTGQRIVSEQESSKLSKIQMTQIVGQKMAPTVGVGVAYLGARKSSKMSQRYNQVNKYFEKHPNSERSYAEVYASLDKKRGDKNYVVNETKLEEYSKAK